MRVKDIMQIHTIVIEDMSVFEAVKIMAKKGIGSILVQKDGAVKGIFTERDVLKKVVARDIDPKKTRLSEMLSNPLITINSDRDVREASELMRERGIRRLPVVEAGKIVGIVTLEDITKSLAYQLFREGQKQTGYNRPDYKAGTSI